MKMFIQWFLFNSSYNWIETPRSQVPILDFPLMTLLKLFVLFSCSFDYYYNCCCCCCSYYSYYYYYYYYYYTILYYTILYTTTTTLYYYLLFSTSVYVLNRFSLLLTYWISIWWISTNYPRWQPGIWRKE